MVKNEFRHSNLDVCMLAGEKLVTFYAYSTAIHYAHGLKCAAPGEASGNMLAAFPEKQM
jgi:hypothetical protein